MCIAIYIPEGKNITEKQIRNAFSNNPDGAGVMHYNDDGQVCYAKGFMDVDKLITYWEHNTSDRHPRAIHCRIATSGKVSKGCCHPFPITDKLDDMLVSHGISPTGCLIHNGIFRNYTPKEGMLCKYSDTMFYTKKVIYPLMSLLNNSGVEELLQDMTSRVLVFLPNYEVHKYGEWEYEKAQGFYASNDTYDYDIGYFEELHKKFSLTNTRGTTYSTGITYLPPTTTSEGGDDDDITDYYEVGIKARDMYEAENEVNKFIGIFWGSLPDFGMYAYETLSPYDEEDNDWYFAIESRHDITRDIIAEGYDILCHADRYGNEIGGE